MNVFIKKFKWTIIIINLVTIAQFFKIIYIGIFNYFLVIWFIENRLFKIVLTYFEIIKINSKEILNLYYLI